MGSTRIKQSFQSAEDREEKSPVQSTSELAKRLGLSRWTVSRVINGHEGIRPETRLLVQSAMRDLGFSPNSLAQGLRKGRTNMIGVCLPEIEGFYLGQKLEFLRQALADHGYHVMIAMTNGDALEEADALSRFRVLCAAGVILVASRLSARSAPVRQFQKTQIPLVFVDPMIKPPAGSLAVDRAAGMREAMHHLFDLGHRKFTVLGLSRGGRYTRMRLKGIAEACHERGLEKETSLRLIGHPPDGVSLHDFGRQSAEAVWRGHKGGAKERTTAVLVLNDRVAVGLIDGLRRLGVRVPEAVSIVGYDNMEMGAFIAPTLTTIDAQPDELVAQTAARLLHQIRNPESQVETLISIPTRLVVRGSTARAH